MPDSTINGLTAVLGTNVDQTADQFPIWVNSASTTRKISRTELFNGPAVGGIGSAIRAAASDYAAVAFDGATASTRITSTLTGQNIGTGDFSLWARFRVPASVNAVNRGLIALTSNATSTAQAESAHLFLAANAGELAFRLYGATASDLRQATVNGFLAAYTGQVVDVVVTRTGTTLKIYINGTDTAYSESTGGTPPAWSATVTSTFCNVGMAVGVAWFSGRIYRSVVFNRALSASDVTELITVGVNPADQWGTQTQVIGFNPAVLNGGFETNSLNASGTWGTVVAGTSTATIDTSGSFSRTGTNAGKLTLDASGSSAIFTANNNNLSTLAVNKRYRVSIWARKGATSGSCGVRFGGQAGGVYGDTGLTLTTTYANTVAEFVTVIDGSFTMFRLAGSAGLSEIYIDDVEVTRIGAIVDLDFTVGAGYQATDRSTNNLHGTLFNGVEFTVPRRMAVLYATTSFNGDTLVLGSNLSIPTNAIIEDIICNSSGTATVSIGTAPAGTTIVNSASVVAGRQKLTIGTPFSSNGTLYVKSNSAAVLQFTILYTVAA